MYKPAEKIRVNSSGRTETLYGILAPTGGGWLPLGNQSGVRVWRNRSERDAELRRLNGYIPSVAR